MPEPGCIFCKIIKGDIPSKLVKQTSNILVIQDIAPKAPVHYLIIPKKHVRDLISLQEEDSSLIWDTVKVVKELSSEPRVDGNFALLTNNGAGAGQSVFHLHWHFVAGRKIGKGEF